MPMLMLVMVPVLVTVLVPVLMLVLMPKHQRSPRKFWLAAACCGTPRHAAACRGMLQAVGQGYHHFPKEAQVSKTCDASVV